MQADTQAQVAFFLTGRRPAPFLDPVDGLELRPALLAGYRDLAALRHDYPVVLVAKDGGATPVRPLSALVDEAFAKAAVGDDAARVRQHGLRLEQEIRALLAGGHTAGPLSVVWDLAVSRLLPKMDPAFADSCKRLRAAIKVDGELADCDAAVPERLVRHLWQAAQAAKAAAFRERLERLVAKLSDILRADYERSREGLSASRLRASVGAAHADMIDFDGLSKLLVKVQPKQGMPESRRARIQSLLDVLRKQRFFAGVGGGTAKPYEFAFDTCGDALKAYAEREPKLVELARAVVIAELEIDGEYSPERHDALFEGYGATGLSPEELAAYPDSLVCLNGSALSAQEHGRLMQLLASGWPIKVLLQIDDLHDAAASDGAFAAGLRSSRIATQAMALNDAFVLQASSSHLVGLAPRVQRGLAYAGASLFSVFSGASGARAGLPPYLMAAAAMESRAFPAFSYDPSAGPEWADRFCLAANTQVEQDWPLQAFAYEDDRHQRVAQTVPFTLVDFLASDPRSAPHLARVPREKWNGSMIGIDESLARPDRGLPDHVPSLLMVDARDRLQKVVVDQSLVRQAERCRQMWHSLQELAGVHNSHARKLLAREQQAWEQRLRDQAPAAPAAPSASAPAAAAAAAVVAPPPAPVVALAEEPARDPAQAYIETERCSSCNECTQLNPKMFAYNENQQAYIADVNAGTFAELVQAAENCQVAVIHPGQPRNANEPGLAELLERAKPFQ
jgi:ferredoxin